MQSRFRLLMPQIVEKYSRTPPTIAPNRLYPNAVLVVLRTLRTSAKAIAAKKIGMTRTIGDEQVCQWLSHEWSTADSE